MVRSTVCCNKFKHENLLFRLLTVMSLSIVSRKALALSLSLSLSTFSLFVHSICCPPLKL